MNEAGGFRALAAKLAFTALSVMALVAAAWAGLNAWRFQQERQAVREDEKVLREIGELVPKVKGLAEAGYTEDRLREERQTGQWVTFFANAAASSGFSTNQYRLPTQNTNQFPGFLEHKFEIRLNPKTGVSRKMIVQLLWTIESRRTYLKALALDLERASADSDDWGGSVTLAYREKR
jgi:hypothetical protein